MGRRVELSICLNTSSLSAVPRDLESGEDTHGDLDLLEFIVSTAVASVAISY